MLSFLEEKNLLQLSNSILQNINQIPKDFDNISSLILNKNFIHNNKKFLIIINIKLNPYQLRMFLSSIMIKYCPEEIFQEIKDIEENLILNASKFLDSYISLLQNPYNSQNFHSEVSQFLTLFQIWKDQDQKKFLFVLSSTYNELIPTSKMIQPNDDSPHEIERIKIWNTEIEKQKKSLEKAVYQIGGEKAIEKMIDGSFWLDVITPEFRILINNNLKDSFKNKLYQEVISNQIPFTIIKCLKEISNHLQKNNPNIHNQLKIELLNMQLNKDDYINIIIYNLQIFMKEINFNYTPNKNPENIVDSILIIYEQIGK